jgi:hypothetical protein
VTVDDLISPGKCHSAQSWGLTTVAKWGSIGAYPPKTTRFVYRVIKPWPEEGEMDTVATVRLGAGRQAWNFAQHFLEMCVSMCAVGTPLILLLFVFGPAVIGYPDPRQQFPELSLLTVAVLYALPMVAWMRYRGMEWRPIVEMGGATIAVGVAIVGLAWLGILSQPGLRDYASPKFCGPACAVMLLAMLPRIAMYTGRTGHHMGHGALAAHAT